MEHRWGQRKSLSTTVQLRTQGGLVALGRVLNVSLSGAFVQTALQAPLFSRVQLIISLDPKLPTAQIEAQIVRQTEAGVGLEWNEFGGDKIEALIAQSDSVDLSWVNASQKPAVRARKRRL